MDKLEELAARTEISDALFRYARAVDRRDWQSLHDCFHADAVDHHGEFVGGPSEFIDWVSARHAEIPFAMHFLGNCLIEFLSDDAAAVETYFVAIQRREDSDANGTGGTDFEVFGRYVDRFELRGSGWKIASRKVVYDATRTQPSSDHLRERIGVQGTRNRTDPVFSAGS